MPAVLGVDDYELEKVLQDGRFAWVLDIGTGKRKPERRVLAYCVFEHLGNPIPGVTPTSRLEFDRVAELILGSQRELFRSRPPGGCTDSGNMFKPVRSSAQVVSESALERTLRAKQNQFSGLPTR